MATTTTPRTPAGRPPGPPRARDGSPPPRISRPSRAAPPDRAAPRDPRRASRPRGAPRPPDPPQDPPAGLPAPYPAGHRSPDPPGAGPPGAGPQRAGSQRAGPRPPASPAGAVHPAAHRPARRRPGLPARHQHHPGPRLLPDHRPATAERQPGQAGAVPHAAGRGGVLAAADRPGGRAARHAAEPEPAVHQHQDGQGRDGPPVRGRHADRRARVHPVTAGSPPPRPPRGGPAAQPPGRPERLRDPRRSDPRRSDPRRGPGTPPGRPTARTTIRSAQKIPSRPGYAKPPPRPRPPGPPAPGA